MDAANKSVVNDEMELILNKGEICDLTDQLDDLSIAIEPGRRERNKNATSFIIGVEDNIEGLSQLVKIFEDLELDVIHIESRRPQRRDNLTGGSSEIFVDVDCASVNLESLVEQLRNTADLIAVQLPEIDSSKGEEELGANKEKQVWPPAAGEAHAKTLIGKNYNKQDPQKFPRRIQEMDDIAIVDYQFEVDSPGCEDGAYLQRRRYFAEIAANNKYGSAIPKIDYTELEIKTWGTLYRQLLQLYPTHACKAFKENLAQLQKYCGYREDNIPQLEDVSNYIRDRTGFTLRLVASEISARDFLAGLAFRVFHCTQHVRYPDQLNYSAEPDCCHDLLGHVPMLLDVPYARFIQEIGLLSLGAPDEDVAKLAKEVILHQTDPWIIRFLKMFKQLWLLKMTPISPNMPFGLYYFFTAEYGLWKEGGQLKALGASLLSSVGELTSALSGDIITSEFDPDQAIGIDCEISGFAKIYYYLSDIEDAKAKLRKWSHSFSRAFFLRYNAYTQSVEKLDSKRAINSLIRELHNELIVVNNAFRRIATLDQSRGFSRLLHSRLSATLESAEY